MRAPVTTLGVVLMLGIAVGGLPAESAGAQASLGCPATVQAGQQLTIEIAIDVGTTPLGAYSIAVTYDPAVLTVASIAAGSTAQFSGNPTSTTSTTTLPPSTTTSTSSTTTTSTTTTSTTTTTQPTTTTTTSTSTSTSTPTTTSTSSTATSTTSPTSSSTSTSTTSTSTTS